MRSSSQHGAAGVVTAAAIIIQERRRVERLLLHSSSMNAHSGQVGGQLVVLLMLAHTSRTWLLLRHVPRLPSTAAASVTRLALKFDTPTASVSPASTQSARPCRYASLLKVLKANPGQCCMYSPMRCSPRRLRLCRHATLTDAPVSRHGSGANLVAITGEVPVEAINSPRNSSLLPKPYT